MTEIPEVLIWINGLDGFLADLATSVLSICLGVWLSIRFALRKFVTEKWWERQAEAYEAVIRATYHAFRNVDEVLHAEKTGKMISKDLQTELEELAKNAHDEIAEARTLGSLKLSEGFLVRMQRLDKELKAASPGPGESMDWAKYLTDSHHAYSTCLADLQEIARSDLSLKSTNRRNQCR
ncbi:hypothetical protein [uncultured Ruegeria sp.]|uniref:hypothetical protein n=1 Tax=uncultured Ruegeria sp. TaxID=259304 RepID=UPI00260BD1DE|nr:hypothetical protein [uncultured Ruegeria sp.]